MKEDIDFHIDRLRAMVDTCDDGAPGCESCVAELVEIAGLEKLKKEGITRINYNAFYESVHPAINRALEAAGHESHGDLPDMEMKPFYDFSKGKRGRIKKPSGGSDE